MIRRIQALNYRCLRYVDVRLKPFQVLVGANGSGKSALFDVITFLNDLFAGDLEDAVSKRTSNFQDLVWARPKDNAFFELALELNAPDTPRKNELKEGIRYRYELAIREKDNGFQIDFDNLDFISPASEDLGNNGVPASICSRFEDYPNESSFVRLLASVPTITRSELIQKYPEVLHIPSSIGSRVRRLFLEDHRLRNASPPKARNSPLEPDGSNLPWAVQRLQNSNQDRFDSWLNHIRTVIQDLECIRIVEREDDRHAYLMVCFSNGVEAPSWAVSDGTLRLLALTIIAYLPDNCIYLVEEPENGIHPLAIEAVYQSLSSVYESQVLVASHSPEFLVCTEPKYVLCFSKDKNGATQIIPGDKHPRLAQWRNAADVDLLFAPEIIG